MAGNFNFDKWFEKFSLTDANKKCMLKNWLVDNDCNTFDALINTKSSEILNADDGKKPAWRTIGIEKSLDAAIKELSSTGVHSFQDEKVEASIAAAEQNAVTIKVLPQAAPEQELQPVPHQTVLLFNSSTTTTLGSIDNSLPLSDTSSAVKANSYSGPSQNISPPIEQAASLSAITNPHQESRKTNNAESLNQPRTPILPKENFIFEVTYESVMEPLANVSKSLLDAAYSKTYSNYPDEKLCGTWTQAVEARELGDEEKANNLVRYALTQDDWLPQRYVCALSYSYNAFHQQYKYPVPRIEYEAVFCLLKWKRCSVDERIAKIVEETCSDGHHIERYRWSFCECPHKKDCKCFGRCFTTEYFTLSDHDNTSKLDISKLDSKDFMCNDLNLWDEPKWLHGLTYWPSQKNDFRSKYLFFNQKFNTLHPLLLEHNKILRIEQNPRKESISTLAKNLNRLRNHDKHKASLPIHLLVAALRFLHAAKLFANCVTDSEIAKNIKVSCEIANEIIQSKQSNLSTIACDWQSYYEAVGRYEADIALRVLVSPPMDDFFIGRTAIPAAPWDVVVDFTEDENNAGKKSPLWKLFEAAEAMKCEAASARKETHFLHPQMNFPKVNLAQSIQWVQPLIDIKENTMPNCFDKDGKPAQQHQSAYGSITKLLSDVVEFLKEENKQSVQRPVKVVIPLFGMYALEPKREGTTGIFGHDISFGGNIKKSYSFATFLNVFLRKLISGFPAENLSVLILTAKPRCYDYLTDALESGKRVWPVQPFLDEENSFYLQHLTVAFCNEFHLDWGYFNEVASMSSFNDTVSKSGGIRISGNKIFCNTSSTASHFSCIEDSVNRMRRLLQNGLQLLHLELPSTSLTDYEKADHAYATYIQKNPISLSDISAPMKLAAIEFACGNAPKWAIVADGRNGSKNLISMQEKRYNELLGKIKILWKKASTTYKKQWLNILELKHESRHGATTLMMQLAWNFFFDKEGAAVLVMQNRESYSGEPDHLEEDLRLLLRITNPVVHARDRIPIVLLVDRNISDIRMKQIIDAVMEHNEKHIEQHKEEIIPLFVIRLSYLDTPHAFPLVSPESIRILEPTAEDLSEVDECAENILLFLNPELNQQEFQNKLKYLRDTDCIRDMKRFSCLRGMILFKTLGDKVTRRKFEKDIEDWIGKLTANLYSRVDESSESMQLRSLLHTLCYVALVQMSGEEDSRFTAIPTRLLLGFLADPEDAQWMFTNHESAEGYLLATAHNNLFAKHYEYQDNKGESTAGFGLIPFPFYRDGQAIAAEGVPCRVPKAVSSLEDVLTYKVRPVQGRGEAPIPVVRKLNSGSSEFNDFERKAKKLLSVDEEEIFWYEALIFDNNCLKFNAEFVEPFLRSALLQEAQRDSTLESSPLRDSERHSDRFYYCIVKLLYSIARDRPSMELLKKQAEGNKTGHGDRSLAFQAKRIFTSRQTEILKHTAVTKHDNKKFSKAIGEVAGRDMNLYRLNNAGCIDDLFCWPRRVVVSPIMLFFIAQSVYHNHFALYSATVRFIHLQLNAVTESIILSDLDDQRAHNLQQFGDTLFAIAVSHCYTAFYCDESRENSLSRCGALVLLGNTARFLMRLTSKVSIMKLNSLVAKQSNARGGSNDNDIITEFIYESLWNILSIANMARYWYEVSLHLKDQSYPVSDEAFLWIEVMDFFVMSIFKETSLNEDVKKSLRDILFSSHNFAANVDFAKQSKTSIDEKLDRWSDFYCSYQKVKPTHESINFSTFHPKDLRVYTISDLRSKLASKALDLSLTYKLDPIMVGNFDQNDENDSELVKMKIGKKLYGEVKLRQELIEQFCVVIDGGIQPSSPSPSENILHYYLKLFNEGKSNRNLTGDTRDKWLCRVCLDIVSSAMRCWYSDQNGNVNSVDVQEVLKSIEICMHKLNYHEGLMKVYIEMSPYRGEFFAVDYVIGILGQWAVFLSQNKKSQLIVDRYKSICFFYKAWGNFELNRQNSLLEAEYRLDKTESETYEIENLKRLNGSWKDGAWNLGELNSSKKSTLPSEAESRKSDDLIFVCPPKSILETSIDRIPLTMRYRRRFDYDSYSHQDKLYGRVIDMSKDSSKGSRRVDRVVYRGVVELIGFQGLQLSFSIPINIVPESKLPKLDSFCSLRVSFWSHGISAIDVERVEGIKYPFVAIPRKYICSIVEDDFCVTEFTSSVQNLTDLPSDKRRELLTFLQEFRFSEPGSQKVLQERIKSCRKGDHTIIVASRNMPNYHANSIAGVVDDDESFSVYWLFSRYLSFWKLPRDDKWDRSSVALTRIGKVENMNSFNGLIVIFDPDNRKLVAAKEGIVVMRKNRDKDGDSKCADVGILYFSTLVVKENVVKCLEKILMLATPANNVDLHRPLPNQQPNLSFNEFPALSENSSNNGDSAIAEKAFGSSHKPSDDSLRLSEGWINVTSKRAPFRVYSVADPPLAMSDKCISSIFDEKLIPQQSELHENSTQSLKDNRNKLIFLDNFRFCEGHEQFQNRIRLVVKGPHSFWVDGRSEFEYHVKSITGPSGGKFSVYWLFEGYLSLFCNDLTRQWYPIKGKPKPVNKVEKLTTFNKLMLVFDKAVNKLVAVKEGIVVVQERENITVDKVAAIGIMFFPKSTKDSANAKKCVDELHSKACSVVDECHGTPSNPNHRISSSSFGPPIIAVGPHTGPSSHSSGGSRRSTADVFESADEGAKASNNSVEKINPTNYVNQLSKGALSSHSSTVAGIAVDDTPEKYTPEEWKIVTSISSSIFDEKSIPRPPELRENSTLSLEDNSNLIFLDSFRFCEGHREFQDRIRLAVKGPHSFWVHGRSEFEYHVKSITGSGDSTVSIYWLFEGYLSFFINSQTRQWDTTNVKPKPVNKVEQRRFDFMLVLDKTANKLVAVKEGIVVVRERRDIPKLAAIGIMFFPTSQGSANASKCVDNLYEKACAVEENSRAQPNSNYDSHMQPNLLSAYLSPKGPSSQLSGGSWRRSKGAP